MYHRPGHAKNALEAALIAANAAVLDVDVWPENWRPFMLFCQIRTQWRMGPGGPVGLDYNVLYRKLDRLHVTDEEAELIEADIRAMEASALEVIHEKND